MLDGGGEFSEVNGFGEILIHPGIEAKLPVLFHGVGGKSDDWNAEASGTLEGANGARRVITVQAGHLDVHYDQVEPVA